MRHTNTIMKLLFANPPWWGEHPFPWQGIRAGSRWPFTRQRAFDPDAFRFGSYMPFPFFLASAAGHVDRECEDIEVAVRDSVARGESYTSFLRAVMNFAPDAMVVEVGAASWEHDRNFLRMVKHAIPKLRIAIAGPTARTVAVEADFDAYLLGEYEHASVAFARGKDGVIDPRLLTVAELKEAAFPMFDERAALHYWDGCPKGQQAPHLQLFASRGCPYRCCFCAWPATMTGNDPDGNGKRSVRFYSVQWLEDFIRMRMDVAAHVHDQPLRSIYFDDDTFNLSDRHVLEVCEMMKRIGLPWSAMCRADTSKRETWQAMRDSGCFGVKLGFESASQRVVDEIVGKNLNIAEGIETARWLRSIGMTVHGTFTVGLPGEKDAERIATSEFIKRHWVDSGGDALDTYQLSGTATIEGTPLDRIAHGEKLAKFPGATPLNFEVNADGLRKLSEMNGGGQ